MDLRPPLAFGKFSKGSDPVLKQPLLFRRVLQPFKVRFDGSGRISVEGLFAAFATDIIRFALVDYFDGAQTAGDDAYSFAGVAAGQSRAGAGEANFGETTVARFLRRLFFEQHSQPNLTDDSYGAAGPGLVIGSGFEEPDIIRQLFVCAC